MHLVSYEFGLIKALPEGEVGVNVSHPPKQDYLRKGRRVRKKEERDGNFFPERKRKAKRTEEENFAVVKVLIWNTFAKFFCDKANPRCDYTCICGPSNWLLAEASDSLSSANWHWAISKWKRATDDATYLQLNTKSQELQMLSICCGFCDSHHHLPFHSSLWSVNKYASSLLKCIFLLFWCLGIACYSNLKQTFTLNGGGGY